MQKDKTFPADPILRKRAEDEIRKNSRSTCHSEMDVLTLCHELEVKHVELQLQNEELQRITAELAASEDKYRDHYEFAPIGYLTVEPSDGTITSLNPAFEKITGWSTAQWLGKSFLGIVHPEDLPVAQEMFNETLKGGYALPHELRGIGKEQVG